MDIVEAFKIYPFETFCIKIHSADDITRVQHFFEFPNDQWDYLDDTDEYPHLLVIMAPDEDGWSDTGHNDMDEWDEHINDDECFPFDIIELERLFDPTEIVLNKMKKEIHGV